MSWFSDTFLGGAGKKAAASNRAAADQYGTDAMGYLAQGYNTGQEQLGNALGAYSPLADLAKKYTGGTDMLLNAYGINGQAGNEAARGAFQQAPGYQYQMDQGLEALDRRRAITGMYGSGNADADAIKFSQGLADQGWNAWTQGLQGINQNALSATGAAASGQAGVYGGLADLARGYAGDQVGVAGNVLSGNVGANNLQAQSQIAGGQSLASLALGIGSLGANGAFKDLGSTLSNATGFNPIGGAAGGKGTGWKY